MKRIKVKLVGQGSSQNRGVGFYHSFLKSALANDDSVQIVESNPDLVHYTFFDPFYPTLPLVKTHPTVVTIHDLTPLILSSLYPQGIKSRLSLIHQKLSLQTVKLIITDSQNSKSDINKLFNIPLDRIVVTPLAVDPLFTKLLSEKDLRRIKDQYNLPDKFVLTVAAGPNPNKNLPLLAEITQELNIPLVIVGGGVAKSPPSGKIHAELRDLLRLKEFDHLLTPGFVPTEELVGFYQLATIYCQASLYEGFGLPVLEAMTAGCLVVSSNASSLPEVYPPQTISFDPSSPSSMRTAISTALKLGSDQKRKLITVAKAIAQDFSWQKTAAQTAKAYSKTFHA